MLENEASEAKLEQYRQIPNPAAKMDSEADTTMSTPQEQGEAEEGDQQGQLPLTQEQVMQLVQKMFGPLPVSIVNADNEDEDGNDEEDEDGDHEDEDHEEGNGHAEEEQKSENEDAGDVPDALAASRPVDDSAIGAQSDESEELSSALNALSLENAPARQQPRNIHGCTLADHRVIAGCTAVVAYRKVEIVTLIFASSYVVQCEMLTCRRTYFHFLHRVAERAVHCQRWRFSSSALQSGHCRPTVGGSQALPGARTQVRLDDSC